MDPVTEQTVTTTQEEKPVVQVATEPKQGNFLVILLSILLIISCLIAGFFAYQTQNLVKELTTLKNSIEQTPTATSLPTEAPITTGSEVVSDAEENWKVYTDSEWGFTFKYPDVGLINKLNKRDGLLVGGATFSLLYKDATSRPQKSEIYVRVYDSQNMDLNSWLSNNSTTNPFGSDENKEFFGYLNQGVGSVAMIQGVKFKNDVMGFISHNIAIKKGNYIYIIGNLEVSDNLSSIYDQILSTFKFTN